MAQKKKTTTKKAVAAVATAAALASCAPAPLPQKEITRTIVVRLAGVVTGEMATKTDPSGVFNATAPAQMPTLTLQSKTVPSRSYQVTPGQNVTVAVDSYAVSGKYLPMEEGQVQNGKIYSRPPFSVAGEITVTEEVAEYEVAAAYDCFAIVLDTSVCEKYRIRGYGGSMVDMTWIFGTGAIKVAYMVGQWDFPALDLIAVPADPANYENAAYAIINDPAYAGEGKLLARNGKWYAFDPSAVQTTDGAIGVGLPEWENGNE